jgi:hypothetical protein
MAETADVVEFGSAPAPVTPAPRLSGLAQLARGAVSRS